MNTKTQLVRTWGILGLTALLSSGCVVSSGSTASAPPPAEESKDKGANKTAEKKEKEEKDKKQKEEKKGPALAYTLKDVGFEGPESMIYDEEEDVYLVSNVSGDPLAEDTNGFISKVGVDGKLIELKWIDGAKKGVSLNAPKGIAVSQGFIYVADITWIRIFDRKTGEPKGKIFAKGATFLNDVQTDVNGDILFSDTGWKSGKDGFASSGSDAVYRVDPKTVAAKAIVRDASLGNPNGLAATKAGVWVVNDQGELFLLGKDGKKEQTTKLPQGGLDGVIALDDGSFIVSSWKGEGIYRGKPGEEFKLLIAGLKSPANIGYDKKHNRLLVPKMLENEALIFELSAKAKAKAAITDAAAAAAVAGKPAKDAEAKAKAAITDAAAAAGKPAKDAEAKAKEAITDAAASAAAAGKPAKDAGAKKQAASAETTAEKKEKKAAPPAEKKAEPAKPAATEKKAEPAKPAATEKKAEPAKPASGEKKAEPAKPAPAK